MIPIILTLSGFLSYHDPVEIDFTGFELACIAGPNGAGKSSLLDAITWALFGQARKRDDSIINAQSSTAEVSLVFEYEGNHYHVQRIRAREKTTMLEFHILGRDETNAYQEGRLKTDGGSPAEEDGLLSTDNGGSSIVERLLAGTWKPLTERTLRATENRIQETLRMDYETFTNASFFLQGKADQFTQQRPGDRKRILSSILGLEVWENYRQRAGERRRGLEGEIAVLDGRLSELLKELSEEDERKRSLEALQDELARLSQQRALQESILANIRAFEATMEEQKRLVETLARQLANARNRCQADQERLAQRMHENQANKDLLARAEHVEEAYEAWEAMRTELQRLESTAQQFREYEKGREGPRAEIQAARGPPGRGVGRAAG